MDKTKEELTRNKYRLPYHWIRDPLSSDSLQYFGYAQMVLDQLPATPARILDAGCGDGRISAEIVRLGHDLVGIDYLDISVEYARALVPDGTFYVGDLRESLTDNFPIQRDEFDIVVLVEVYEHIPTEDGLKVLRNLHEILKPGGKLIISVPSKSVPPSKLHYRHFGEAELLQELSEAAFTPQNILYQHRLTRTADWVLHGLFNKILNNGILEPVFLSRWRRSWYFSHINVADDANSCGRIIVVAAK